MSAFLKRFRWVTILAGLTLVAGLSIIPSVGAAPAKTQNIVFRMFPNKAFVPCMAANPNVTPFAAVNVKRDSLNDQLDLRLVGFKPGIQFDLFTVQNSPQLANGTANTSFKNFGLAWYQSDVEADGGGSAHVKIKTILLDQVFGFDPAASLAPTNTFHVGFWFNNPADAAPCGFKGVTPFNGDHTAGPLAFITRPSAATGLGPLCTDPSSEHPGTCNP
jgi:hypothetical protein